MSLVKSCGECHVRAKSIALRVRYVSSQRRGRICRSSAKPPNPNAGRVCDLTSSLHLMTFICLCSFSLQYHTAHHSARILSRPSALSSRYNFSTRPDDILRPPRVFLSSSLLNSSSLSQSHTSFFKPSSNGFPNVAGRSSGQRRC